MCKNSSKEADPPSIINRYADAGIKLYHDKVDKVDKFPFEVSDEFLKYEEENLLIC